MNRWIRSTLVLTLGAVNLTFRPAPPSAGPARATAFVVRDGPRLTRHGQPFRFVGVNCYRLTEYVDTADEIFNLLAAARVQVVRFWAFQAFCGPSGRDFSKFDALVAAARRHDILLLPVLENHWRHCTYTDQLKPPAWYQHDWKTVGFAEAPLPYRAYLGAIGSHFRDEPEILAWQLVNELEIYPDTKENFAALKAFAAEAAAQLKQADPNHLVSLGLLGLGQPSTTGPRFRALHNQPAIELVSAHDHGYMNEPLPGRDWPQPANSFYADLGAARSLGKPFLATEAGIALRWVHGDRSRRAKLFRAKLAAFFAAGGTGYLLWNYEPIPDTDWGFGPTDPILPVIAAAAARLEAP